MTTELDEMLTNAKMGIMIKGSRFLATIIFSMNHEWNESIPTARTNGLKVEYNPEFFKSLTKDERVGLIAHEGWHPALLHLTRLGTKDPKIWNYAGDYVINQLLVDADIVLPKGGLQDNKYRGMSTDAIYEKLIQESSENLPSNPLGEDLQYPTNPEKEKELDVKLKSVLVKAKTRSEMAGEAGTIPGEVLRLIDELLNPKLPWEVLLDNFLTEKIKADYTWKKPNKRFMPDMIMPSLFSEGLGHLTIAIDTSGSLSKKALTKILSEIVYIHQTMKPKQLTIIDCDYVIHHTHKVTDVDVIMELEFSGNGGTSFDPVFDQLKDNPPQALIYFTDLYAPQILEEPGYPVLWICTSNHDPAPIGQTIYLK